MPFLVPHEELVEALGSAAVRYVVDRLHRLALIPDAKLAELSQLALSENWGQGSFALEKYLAVHVSWSIEQGRYTTSDNQLYTTAGHLQTRYGTPLYLVFERNPNAGSRPPLLWVHVGSSIRAPALPTPPDIPAGPEITRGAEIVLVHDHILRDNADRVQFLLDTPPVSQMCAVAGAIQWSLNRGLQIPYWYYGRMGYLVPLYMQNRENITLAPDVIAPIQVDPEVLTVRTVLVPQMAYPCARVAVKRHDQLPHWMLAVWNDFAATVTPAQIEDPEPVQ